MCCTLPLEFTKFLNDVCVKNNVDCSPPRTASRLLDKVCVMLQEKGLVWFFAYSKIWLVSHPPQLRQCTVYILYVLVMYPNDKLLQ